MTGESTVRFEVLGPLRAWQGEERLTLGPVQQRVVLAVLLLQANRPLGREQLIEAVWGSDPPVYAVNLLQKHMSGLRRSLEPSRPAREPSRLLAWTDGGYLLTVPPGRLDLEVFDREVGLAHAAQAAGDLPRAAAALHAALGHWRGPLCDGLAGPWLDAERDRLSERRIALLEERVEVDLALGAHLDLVAELGHLIVEHPLRERLRGLLMLALYRSGRQGEALAAFQAVRRHLRDELGIEPGTELQRLHQQILAADPALAPPPPPAPGPGPGPGPGPAQPTPPPPTPAPEAPPAPNGISAGSVPEPAHELPAPAQLPHGMADFTGRDAELERLHALAATHGAATGGAVLITALAGTAGVGKTALAVHWAHQIRAAYPDGQLYVNLRGFDPTGSAMEPEEAIRGFLDAFAVPTQRIPVSLEAQAALYRSLLAGRRVLVVLDNARDLDQVRPLLPGAPGALVVVTSRNQLPGLVAAHGAHVLALNLLTVSDARELLARRLGRERVSAEPQAVEDIIALSARLPLALAIVAARATTHPSFPLGALADELREARGGLDGFDGGDQETDVRAVLSWSYHALRPEAARLFRLLGVHPGPDIATAAAASLAGAAPGQVRRLLAELTRAHLVSEHLPGRFTFHDLLRAYAAELAEDCDAEEDRRSALLRVLDHYLHTAHAACLTLDPHREPLAITAARPEVTIATFANHDQALTWFTTEAPVLLAAVEEAGSAGLDAHTWQLAWTMTTFFDRRGQWHDAVATHLAALAATRRLADRRGQAHAHRVLAYAHTQLGSYEQAHENYRSALALFADLDDRTGQAHTHLNLTRLFDRRGAHREALHHAQRALDLYREADHRSGQIRALNAVGWCHALLGDHVRTLALCQEALDLHREVRDRDGEAHTWDTSGYAHHHLGHHSEAISCLKHALDLWRDLGDRYYEADTLIHLGEAHLAAGSPDQTRAAWHRALDILGEFGHPDADTVHARLHALDDRAGPEGTVVIPGPLRVPGEATAVP